MGLQTYWKSIAFLVGVSFFKALDNYPFGRKFSNKDCKVLQ